MLNERERRSLAEIERRVTVEDPRFAASMCRGYREASLGHDVVIALAGSTTLLCTLLVLPGPALVAGLLVAVAAWCRPRAPLPMPPGDHVIDRGGAHR